MRAALERIAAHRFDGSCHAIDPKDCFDVYEEVARAALVHVAALPENDTEARLVDQLRRDKNTERTHRLAAEARLAQIAELLNCDWPSFIDNEAGILDQVMEALRLARGEEPA